MNLRTIVGILVASGGLLILAATPATAQDVPCSACGPGEHWIDSCAAGQDTVTDHGALVGIDTDLDCQADVSTVVMPCSSSNLVVSRSGPLDDSANFPGERDTDGHLDVIDTEIVQMCLTDGSITLRAGAGQGEGGALAQSLGVIAEDPDDSESADSFFDVFFEIQLGDGTFVYNQTALLIEININCVPPQAQYLHPTGCLDLFSSPVVGQGTLVAKLVSAEHHININAQGACCAEDGECTMATQTTCDFADGTLHPGSDCDTTGACCLSDGTCLALTRQCCRDLDGVYQGSDTSCIEDVNTDGVADVCELPEGACCLSGGECTTTTEQACDGDYLGDDVACLSDSCIVIEDEGACCSVDSECTVTTESACDGTYKGDETECLSDTCFVIEDKEGACCSLDGECTIVTESSCDESGGTYQGDETECFADNCAIIIDEKGACCHDSECILTTEAACDELGATYKGDGTQCEADTCECKPSGPCGNFGGTCLILLPLMLLGWSRLRNRRTRV